MKAQIPPEGEDRTEAQIIRRGLAVAGFIMVMFLIVWAVLSFGGVR